MFNTEKYVIYKRVSGGHNQKSGLGLDAQSDEINAYLYSINLKMPVNRGLIRSVAYSKEYVSGDKYH